jgi:hypothetical protein
MGGRRFCTASVILPTPDPQPSTINYQPLCGAEGAEDCDEEAEGDSGMQVSALTVASERKHSPKN